MKYGKSPPDEGDNQETLEASGPLWQAVARLIDDEESAHDMHCQLQRAMVTRGLAEALSHEKQRQHVATTSKLVVVELDKLQPAACGKRRMLADKKALLGVRLTG